MVSEPTFAATGTCGPGAGHGVHCACRLYGVHGVAHVPTLGTRSRVLRVELDIEPTVVFFELF
jgi:hypothetical protein